MEDQTHVKNTYRIIRELGRGSMGTVYEAEDVDNNIRVALKLMNIPAGSSPEYVHELKERMKREAKAASQVKHPNVAQLYDSGTLDGKAFIAMEFCQGTTLSDYLKFEKILPHTRVKEIALRLLSALDMAHKAGVVHRDIKPANIMLTRDGSVKLMDFGIAKLEADPGLTQSGQIMGTPAYMPPEQILGKPVDHRADLFSLGAVLYECLAGEKAFPGETATAVVNQVIQSEPKLLKGLSAPWNGILAKALAKDPGQRYQTAAQMQDDVLVERSPMMAQPSPAPSQPVQPSYQPSAYTQPSQQQPYQPPQQPPQQAGTGGWTPLGNNQQQSGQGNNQYPNQIPDPTQQNKSEDPSIWDYFLTGSRYRRRRNRDYWLDYDNDYGNHGCGLILVIVSVVISVLFRVFIPHHGYGYYHNGYYSSDLPGSPIIWTIGAIIIGVLVVIGIIWYIRRDMRNY